MKRLSILFFSLVFFSLGAAAKEIVYCPATVTCENSVCTFDGEKLYFMGGVTTNGFTTGVAVFAGARKPGSDTPLCMYEHNGIFSARVYNNHKDLYAIQNELNSQWHTTNNATSFQECGTTGHNMGPMDPHSCPMTPERFAAK